MQLLLIGNDADSSSWLVDRMARTGFAGTCVPTHQQAISGGLLASSDVIMVDIARQSPETTGCIRSLRDAGGCQPLLVVASQANWSARVEVLDAGADDYLLKPVSTEEIAARFRAILRRYAGSAQQRIAVGPVELDLKTRCAWLDGACLELTRNEFSLLRMFHLRPGQLLTHLQIAEHLYGPSAAGRSANAVEVLISRLRQKIGSGAIRTVRGTGYKYLAQLPSGQPIARSKDAVCMAKSECMVTSEFGMGLHN